MNVEALVNCFFFPKREIKAIGYWGLGRERRRPEQVVHCVRHSLLPDNGTQLAEVVPGMPRARQVGNDEHSTIQ